MDTKALVNDHTFHVLLNDVFKSRKDNALLAVRLDTLFSYCGTVPRGTIAPVTVAPSAPPPLELPLAPGEEPHVYQPGFDPLPNEALIDHQIRLLGLARENLSKRTPDEAGIIWIDIPVDIDPNKFEAALSKPTHGFIVDSNVGITMSSSMDQKGPHQSWHVPLRYVG